MIKLTRAAVENDDTLSTLEAAIDKMLSAQARSRPNTRKHSAIRNEYTSRQDLEVGEFSRAFIPGGKYEQEHVAHDLDLWYEVAIIGTDSLLEDVGREVETALLCLDGVDIDGIQVAEAVPKAKQFFVANDNYRSLQSNYNAIDLNEAWDLTTGDSSVIVAVVDSGTNTNHPDLMGNLWVNPDEVCANGIDDDNNGYIDDCNGYNFADSTGLNLQGAGSHGIHVAGTIGAMTNNNNGVAGIAGGDGLRPGVAIQTITIFGQTQTVSSVNGIIYAADSGAKVIQNSWGYTLPEYYPQSVESAIQYAVDKGAIVTFAAGNDNDNANYYPASDNNVLAVAAVDTSTGNGRERASFSNYGSWIDISAPGVSIASLCQTGYCYMSGTSMACPHVSGVLALGFSVNKGLTRAQALNCLSNTAVDIDSQNPAHVGQLGNGIINANAFVKCCKALNGEASQQTPLPTPTPTPNPNAIAPVSALEPDLERSPSPTLEPTLDLSCIRNREERAVETEEYAIFTCEEAGCCNEKRTCYYKPDEDGKFLSGCPRKGKCRSGSWQGYCV